MATLGNGSEAPQVGKESETENYSMSRRIVKMTRHLLCRLSFHGSLDSCQVRHPLTVRHAVFPNSEEFLMHIYYRPGVPN